MSQILNHGLYHSDDGEKFGTKFLELIQKAEKATAEYDKNKVSEKISKSYDYFNEQEHNPDEVTVDEFIAEAMRTDPKFSTLVSELQYQ